MQTIESFTAVATIFETTRKITFDSLNGLTITGLERAQAEVVVRALELLSIEQVLRIVNASTEAVRQPNLAKWGPKHEDVATCETASEDAKDVTPEPAQESGNFVDKYKYRVAQTPTTGVNALFGSIPDMESEDPSSELEPLEDAGTVDEDVPVVDEDAPVVDEDGPRVPRRVGSPETLIRPLGVPPAFTAEGEATTPKKRKAWTPDMKSPPRPAELKKLKLPNVGDEHEGSKVIEIKEQADGRLLVREDGWRIKLTTSGAVTARVEGLPPEVDLPTAAEMAVVQGVNTHETDEKVNLDGSLYIGYKETEEIVVDDNVPAEIMQTKTTRDVVTYLIAQGVSDKDDIIGECIKLKSRGAQAFVHSKDDEAVHRRVSNTLLVMGHA